MARRPPAECPVCGADVPRGARACPECGADERSGWDEEATRLDGLDLPDGADGEEGPRPTGGKPEAATWFRWVVAVVLVVIVAWIFVVR